MEKKHTELIMENIVFAENEINLLKENFSSFNSILGMEKQLTNQKKFFPFEMCQKLPINPTRMRKFSLIKTF